MAISTSCPSCQAVFRLADEMAGKKVKFQKCAHVFVIATPEVPAPPPAIPNLELDDAPAPKPSEATAVTSAPSAAKADPDEPSKKAPAKPPPLSKSASRPPLDMRAPFEFDAYLYVLQNNTLLFRDDDSGGRHDARILFRAAKTGQYLIVATSLRGDEIGPYRLFVRRSANGLVVPPNVKGFDPD